MLTCEDEILNPTETTLVNSLDKKIAFKKDRCLTHPISLVVVYLFLLVVISINCYYCHTKHWSSSKLGLPYFLLSKIKTMF